MRLFFFILFCFSSLISENLFIISNNTFPLQKLSEKQIKKIFLKNIDYIHSMPIYPVNLASHHRVRTFFRDRILEMSKKEVKQYWVKAHYKGKRAPVTQITQESIIKFVQEVDGSVGYIYTQNPPSNVKILYSITLK